MTVSNSYRAKQAKISLVILAVLAVLYFFFAKDNTNTSIEGSWERTARIAELARANGKELVK